MAPVSITLLFLLLSQVIPAATELETPPEPTSMMIVGRGKSKQDPPSPSPRPWRLLHAAGRGLLAQDKGETRSPAPGMAPCSAGLEVGTPPPHAAGEGGCGIPSAGAGTAPSHRPLCHPWGCTPRVVSFLCVSMGSAPVGAAPRGPPHRPGARVLGASSWIPHGIHASHPINRPGPAAVCVSVWGLPPRGVPKPRAWWLQRSESRWI